MASSVPRFARAATLVLLATVGACSIAGGTEADLAGLDTTPSPRLEASTVPPPAGDEGATTGADVPAGLPEGVTARPSWLGTRTLATTPDGRVTTPLTTPAELRDRRLVTEDVLDPPDHDRFVSTVGPVPDDVLARSTWRPGCPVEPEDLSYLTMAFWGFDGRPHTGEMIVHREVAADVVTVFEALHQARFPIEEMRVTSAAELGAPPTGDGNNSTAFVCRAVTGGSAFSEHAKGLAVDVNPFHNPYRRGELILPELAGHYLDRSLDQPGMIVDGDEVTEAFAAIGWTWGGSWRSLVDHQHFSRDGR